MTLTTVDYEVACAPPQLFGDKTINPLFIVKLNRSSADIPSRPVPVTQQEAGTLRNTVPSMVISDSVIRADRTDPFAVCVSCVNCRDCGSIPTFRASSAERATTLRRYLPSGVPAFR